MQRSLAALFFCFIIGNPVIAQDRDSIRGTFIENASDDLGKDFLLDSIRFFKESSSDKIFILYLPYHIYVRMGREYVVDGIFAQKHLKAKWGKADCKRVAQLAWPDLNSTDLKRIAPSIESSLKEYAGTSLLLVSSTTTVSDNKVQEPIKIRENIQEPKLIRRINPIYPEIAKYYHISGYVILLISIDEAGNVAAIKFLRGDAALIDAAVAAVREWKFSPMLMDGSPVRTMGTANVGFTIL